MRAPRAAAYARANQGVDRYRQPHQKTAGRIPAPPPPRHTRSPLNRKRFWFFAVVLTFAVAVGAATLGSVLAAPADLAQGPTVRAPAPTGGADPDRPPAVPPGQPVDEREWPEPVGQPMPMTEPVGSVSPAGDPSGRDGAGPAPDRPGEVRPGAAEPGGGAEPTDGVGGTPDPDDRAADGTCERARRAGTMPPGQRKKARHGKPTCPAADARG